MMWKPLLGLESS